MLPHSTLLDGRLTASRCDTDFHHGLPGLLQSRQLWFRLCGNCSWIGRSVLTWLSTGRARGALLCTARSGGLRDGLVPGQRGCGDRGRCDSECCRSFRDLRRRSGDIV